jgi:hypothetical protein
MTVSTDAIRQGIVALVHGVLFFILLALIIWGQREYSKVSAYQSAEDDLAQMADSYRMETIGMVSGVDIIEFILKNDALYDYYIYTEGLDKEAPSEKELEAAAGKSSCKGFVAITKSRYQASGYNAGLWSMEYLTDSVFTTKTGIYTGNTYLVHAYTDTSGTYAYAFSRID